MNFSETVAHVEVAAHATIYQNESVVPMIWGGPGIGKSAAMMEAARSIANKMGLKGIWCFGDPIPEGGANPNWTREYFGVIDKRAGQMDPVDAGGFPKFCDKTNTMRRVMDAWYPHYKRDDLPEYGMLFLDELTSAAPSVQASLFQLLQDRRLGDLSMKQGWVMSAAGNYITDGGVVFKMATPLRSRMAHLEMNSDIDEYSVWGMDSGEIPLSMVAFLRFRPDLLNTHKDFVQKKEKGMAFATERTWHKSAKIEKQTGDENILTNYLSGYVGAGPCAEYLSYRKTWSQMPNLDGILLDPMGSPVPTDAGTLYAVSTGLASRANKNNIDAITKYMDRVEQKSFAVLCVQDAQRRDRSILESAAFAKWAIDNAKLFGS